MITDPVMAAFTEPAQPKLPSHKGEAHQDAPQGHPNPGMWHLEQAAIHAKAAAASHGHAMFHAGKAAKHFGGAH